jgi:hypothetical protein
VGGVGNSFGPFAFLTAVQERTPAGFQAEVNGLLEAMYSAAPGLGFLLGGLAARALSPRLTYRVAALAVATLLIVAGRSLLAPSPDDGGATLRPLAAPAVGT